MQAQGREPLAIELHLQEKKKKQISLGYKLGFSKTRRRGQCKWGSNKKIPPETQKPNN